MVQCVAVCCSVLQCMAVCIFRGLAAGDDVVSFSEVCRSVLQCVAVRCSVLQYVAVCGSMNILRFRCWR